MLPVSLDCSLLIAHSVFSNVYLFLVFALFISLFVLVCLVLFCFVFVLFDFFFSDVHSSEL